MNASWIGKEEEGEVYLTIKRFTTIEING